MSISSIVWREDILEKNAHCIKQTKKNITTNMPPFIIIFSFREKKRKKNIYYTVTHVKKKSKLKYVTEYNRGNENKKKYSHVFNLSRKT